CACMSSPEAASHTRSIPSRSPAATSVPSGLKTTDQTLSPAFKEPRGLPLGVSHKRTTRSEQAHASSLPSRLNASGRERAWPTPSTVGFLLAPTSQRYTLPSLVDAASSRPSELNLAD